MGANDRAQADALDRAWDDLIGRAAVPRQTRPLDPDPAAVPLRLAALDGAAAPRLGRAPNWSEVANRATRDMARRPRRWRLRRPQSPETLPTTDATLMRPALPAAPAGRRQAARWWPLLEFAAALSLIVALLGIALGWDLNPLRDSAPPTPMFGAAPSIIGSPPSAQNAIPPCDPSAVPDSFPGIKTPPRWSQLGAADAPFVHVRTTVEYGDLVLIGGSSGARSEGDAAVMAVDAGTGEERWYQFVDPVEALVGDSRPGGVRVTSIVATPTLIYAVNDHGLVSALDPTTGQIVRQTLVGSGSPQAWVVELSLGNEGATVFAAVAGSNRDNSVRHDIGLAVTEEAILVTADTLGGRLAALSAADGEKLWEVEVAPDMVPEPSLLAFDPATGVLLWRQGFAEPLPSPAVVGDGAVYVSTADDETVALALTDGTVRWRSGAAGESPPRRGFRDVSPTTIQGIGKSLVFSDDTLFVAGATMITALDPADGSARWCAPVGEAFHLTAAAGLILAGTPAGILALDAADGTPRWAVWSWPNEAGWPETLTPDASASSVYIRDWDQVVAFDLELMG